VFVVLALGCQYKSTEAHNGHGRAIFSSRTPFYLASIRKRYVLDASYEISGTYSTPALIVPCWPSNGISFTYGRHGLDLPRALEYASSRLLPTKLFGHTTFIHAPVREPFDCFTSAVHTRDLENRPLHTPVPLITLPNLRLFFFRGTSAYLDGFLTQIRTPLLRLRLFNQLTFTIPHLFQWLSATENFRFNSVQLVFFQEGITLSAYRREGDRVNPFDVMIRCRHIDWQVSTVAQIFNSLVPVLSVVEVLVLSYEET